MIYSVDSFDKKEIALAFLLPLFVFLINPFMGCLTSVIITFFINRDELVYVSFAYCFLFLILIQAQREIVPFEHGDWRGYVSNYNVRYSEFLQAVNARGFREIAFPLWNYFGHFIFGKNGAAFYNFTLDCEMLFLSIATIRLWKYSGLDARYGICAIVLILFFREISQISNNIIRQQFAFSILLMGIVFKYTGYKKWWILVIWAFLTHSFTLMYAPLLLFNLNIKPDNKQLWKAGIAIIVISLLFPIIKAIIPNSGFYILNRVSTADMYRGSDVINPSVAIVFSILMLAVYLKHYYFDNSENKAVWLGSNIMIYQIVILLLTLSMPLVLTRLYITRLPVLSLVLPYVLLKRNFITSAYQLLVILIFMFRFVSETQVGYINISYFCNMTFFELL